MERQKIFNVPDAAQFPISKVVQIVGIKKSQLYAYIKRGDMRCGHYRNNGRKFVTGKEINRFFGAI